MLNGADGLLAVDRKDHGYDTANVHADCAIAISPGLQDNGSIEERLVEIGEIHPVLVEIGEPLRFVPNDLHGLFCSYKINRRQGLAVAFDVAWAPACRSKGCACWI